MSEDYKYAVHSVGETKENGGSRFNVTKKDYVFSNGTWIEEDDIGYKLFNKSYDNKNSALDIALDLNTEVFSLVQERRKQFLKSFDKNPESVRLHSLVEYHAAIINDIAEFLIKHDLKIQGKGKSSGRPKGARNKLTDRKYNWIRDKYYILKRKYTSYTRKEHAELIRSELKTKKPKWWDNHTYKVVSIIDIIKKRKWGD